MPDHSFKAQATSQLCSAIGKSLVGDDILKVNFSNGIITQITREPKPKDEDADIPYIAPGLIDNQVNGYKGIDFTEPGLSVEQVRQATTELWEEGITTYLPTLITSRPSDLIQNLKVLARAMQDPPIKGSIAGIHLEGPYISPEDGYRGVHSKKWTKLPNWDEFTDYRKAALNNIRQVTLAPELDGAIDFIRKARSEGIVVALGHHNAPASTISKAIDAGATISTHLGNGCANTIHRHYNPLWPQLADDRLKASIIADGFHLTIPEMQVFYKAKGEKNLILVSDITKIGGLQPGKYLWHDMEVVLEESGLLKYPAQNVLAGSSMTLRRGIENMLRHTECSLSDAITMSTCNPAQLNGFEDRGSLETGKRADIILFDYDGRDLLIRKSIVSGDVVYDANASGKG
ncbi:MAG TPA: N-acetylglucosamine-6-phosphate deacetylase [Balneolales bacterium]|nr:N-acetylglucosamine-6-phosphate deacetylase [Balneolales bacterium]